MKTTYIYRIDLGHNGKVEHQTFCYSRNSKTAIAYYKDKYRSEKYDLIIAIPFGTADENKHPGPFEELPDEEIKYLIDHHIGFESLYSQKPYVPTNGEFIPINKER